MKKIILIIFSVCTSQFFYGQSVDWIKFFSGNYIERVVDMAIDSNDNIILYGDYNHEIDLDPGPDTLIARVDTANNIFIVKLNSDGNLIWAKTLGNTGFERAEQIKLDNFDNIFISGDFQGFMDFDPGPDSLILDSWQGDRFILKLDSSGNFRNVYVSNSATLPNVRTFTIKPNGNLLLGGNFHETNDFDPGPNVYTISPAYAASFICELDTGMQFVSAQIVADNSGTTQISIDNDQNIILGGYLQNDADFDPGPDTFLLDPHNSYDVFFAEYDSTGNFLWAKTAGNNTNTRIKNLSVDHSGKIYFALDAYGSICIRNNINDTCLFPGNANSGAYLLNFDSSGNLNWSQYLNGLYSSVHCYALAFDQINNIYLSGIYSNSVDFDPGLDTFIVTNYTIASSVYLQVLDSNHTFLNYSGYTGNSLKYINSLKFNSQGNLYAAGRFSGSCTFDTLAGLNYVSQGDDDGFLVKYNPLILGNYSEKIKNNTLSIYPNPGTDQINIKLENLTHGKAKINIINILGTTVWSSTLENSLLNEGYPISLSELSDGIYTIVVSTENKIFSGRYIKLN